MWITTITIDLIAFRDSPDSLWKGDGTGIVEQITQLRRSLRSAENGGDSLPGFSDPVSFLNISEDQSTVVVKRSWNTRSIAQQYADELTNITPHISISVEEQV